MIESKTHPIEGVFLLYLYNTNTLTTRGFWDSLYFCSHLSRLPEASVSEVSDRNDCEALCTRDLAGRSPIGAPNDPWNRPFPNAQRTSCAKNKAEWNCARPQLATPRQAMALLRNHPRKRRGGRRLITATITRCTSRTERHTLWMLSGAFYIYSEIVTPPLQAISNNARITSEIS
jgi:hypothetical protein